MKVFKYNLNLKTSLKSIFVFVVIAFIFFDMRKSYLVTHAASDWGVGLINLGILVCILFILTGLFLVFLNFYHQNNRVVVKEDCIIVPGILRIFKEVEIKYSEILKIEKIENREIKIIIFQLRDGKKYEFISALFDEDNDFITFYEILKNKIESLEGEHN